MANILPPFFIKPGWTDLDIKSKEKSYIRKSKIKKIWDYHFGLKLKD